MPNRFPCSLAASINVTGNILKFHQKVCIKRKRCIALESWRPNGRIWACCWLVWYTNLQLWCYWQRSGDWWLRGRLRSRSRGRRIRLEETLKRSCGWIHQHRLMINGWMRERDPDYTRRDRGQITATASLFAPSAQQRRTHDSGESRRHLRLVWRGRRLGLFLCFLLQLFQPGSQHGLLLLQRRQLG